MTLRQNAFLAGLMFSLAFAAGCGGGAPRFASRESGSSTVQPGAYELHGIASYYADEFHGRTTSNGEVYDMHDLTAAHRTIPFNSLVRVKNLATNQAVTVRINDRGPFKGDRIIDLSYEAAMRIGMIQNGTAPVELEIVELGPSQH
jgi:rare lipoprotein A